MPQASKPKKRRWKNDRNETNIALEQPIVPQSEFVARLCSADKTPDGLRKWIDQDVIAQRANKLLKLMEYYKIDGTTPRSFMELALALGTEFVDGLKLADDAPKAVGNRPVWKGGLGLQLVSEVKIFAERGMTTTEALEFIMKNAPARFGKTPLKDVRKRYYECRRRSEK
jgi:hypothetical protein